MTQSREKAFQAFVDTALRGASEEELRDARRHFCAGFTMGYMLKPEPALTEDEWFALYGRICLKSRKEELNAEALEVADRFSDNGERTQELADAMKKAVE